MCYNKGMVSGAGEVGGIAGSCYSNATITKNYYYSGLGLTTGVSKVTDNTDYLDIVNSSAVSTNENIEVYSEFINWIENQ